MSGQHKWPCSHDFLDATTQVPPNYDSLLGKLIVWAETRDKAISRMKRALAETVISGVRIAAPFWSAKPEACKHIKHFMEHMHALLKGEMLPVQQQVASFGVECTIMHHAMLGGQDYATQPGSLCTSSTRRLTSAVRRTCPAAEGACCN